MTRRYCWRIGQAWEQEDGSTCEECGAPWDSHRNVFEFCGAYVQAKSGHYGQHCRLNAGHEGPHDAS